MGHTRILGSRMPGFQTQVAEEIKDGFIKFCCGLGRSVSTLVASRCHEIDDSQTEYMRPLQEFIAALNVEMTVPPPNKAYNINLNKSSNVPVNFLFFAEGAPWPLLYCSHCCFQ